MNHEYFAVGENRDFIIFNSIDNLSDEPILSEDLEFGEIAGLDKLQSLAWSSGCNFFFVIRDDNIFFCKTYEDYAIKCSKLSYKFIEMYLENDSNKKS